MKSAFVLVLIALLGVLFLTRSSAEAGDCFLCPPNIVYVKGWTACYWKKVVIEGAARFALARCLPASTPRPAVSPLPFKSPIQQQAIQQIYLPLIVKGE